MKRRIFLVFLLLMLLCIPAAAHSGGTDENGGHYDHSTGEYHYHHGHSAHQHPGGICPYINSGSSSGSNSYQSTGGSTGSSSAGSSYSSKSPTSAAKTKSHAPEAYDVICAIALPALAAVFTLPISFVIAASTRSAGKIFIILTAVLMNATFYLPNSVKLAEYPAFFVIVSVLAVGSIAVLKHLDNHEDSALALYIQRIRKERKQREAQRIEDAKRKEVEKAWRKLHDLVELQGKLKYYCDSGIISEAEMNSTAEKPVTDIPEAEAELERVKRRFGITFSEAVIKSAESDIQSMREQRERETMAQEAQSNTRYFYSSGTVYKQKGEQPPVPLGTKWLKVCKILWGIGILFGLITLGYSLAISVASTSVLPTALVVVSILVSLVGMFLAITAFTAVSSLSASRFKFIILLFAFAPISGFVTTFSMYYTFGPYIRLLFASIITVVFALVWSLPNVLYFMRRKCMFVGTDPEADVKIGKPAAEARPVEDASKPEQPAAQAPAPQVKARIKVVPHRVGSEQPVAAEAVKPAPAAAVAQPTAAKQYDWKMIAIIALAALLVAAVVYILVDKGAFDANDTSPSRTESVYVYGDSRIYHRKNCYYSKKLAVSKMMSEYEAVKEGYSPCHRCMG